MKPVILWLILEIKDTAKMKNFDKKSPQKSLLSLGVVKPQPNNNTTLEQPWVREHFSRFIQANKAKLKCLAPRCDKVYNANNSHRCLRKHWAHKHGAVRPSKNITFRFHEEDHVDRLLKFIFDMEMDYATIDSKHFRQFLKSLDPTKPLISAKVARQIVRDKIGDLRRMVVSELARVKSMAFTFEIWEEYGCIGAHFIDQNWYMNSVVLQFEHMEYPITTAGRYDLIQDTIKTMNLKDKLIAITTDDSEQNADAVKELVTKFKLDKNFNNLHFTHYICIAHVVDPMIRSLLEKLEPATRGIIDFVKIVSYPAKRVKHFKEIQQELVKNNQQEAYLPLLELFELRWNSLFLVFERMLKLRTAVETCIQAGVIHETKEVKIDWHLLENLIKFLKPLHDVVMSNPISNTDDKLNSYISLVGSPEPKLIDHLSKDFRHPDINATAAELLEKFTKHNQSIYSDTVFLATVVDPRVKLEGMDEETRTLVKNLVQQILDDDLETQPTSEAEIDELDKYLSSPRLPRNSDILVFWRLNEKSFPKLANLARMILPIQATSTISEDLKEVLTMKITYREWHTDTETFEGNILTTSWLKYICPM